jgi:hypothetical protein
LFTIMCLVDGAYSMREKDTQRGAGHDSWTEVNPRHLTDGVVARYAICAGPAADVIQRSLGGYHSKGIHFAIRRVASLNRDGEVDHVLLAYVEGEPEPPEAQRARRGYSIVDEGVRRLRANGVEDVSLMRWYIDSERSRVLREAYPDGWAGQNEGRPVYPTHVAISGTVGTVDGCRGLITHHPTTDQGYRLTFDGEYIPERFASLDDGPHLLSTQFGIGEVALSWQLSDG